MKLRFVPLSALAVLLLATACTSEQTAPSVQETPKTPEPTEQEEGSDEFRSFRSTPPGMTAFFGRATVSSRGTLRSTGSYEGGDITFYWTKGDHVWIRRTPGASYERNAGSDIEQRIKNGKKTRYAEFYFNGPFSGSTFPIRYTGSMNAYSDRVTIASRQAQPTPNEAMHLGVSGDCGTAVATREGRRFDFTLVRKAAYITFTPYNSQGEIEGGRLTQIKITSADQAINGTFGFDDNGLQLNTRPSHNSVNGSTTLVLGSFTVPSRANAYKTGAIAVIAPGSYRDVTIEYTLEDKGTGVTATITKHIPSISFAAGQRRLISHDLDVMVFDDRYYMWDAQQEYWYDYKRSQPREIYGQNDNYPRRGRRRDAQRIYSTADFPSQGSASARNNPNVNEAHWYVEGGNAHWDDQTVWSGVGHLYRGGVWIRTQQAIRENYRPRRYRFNFTGETYNYYDFTSRDVIANHSKRIIRSGKPSSMHEYFFLPALGYYIDGKLKDIGSQGYYWTRSSTHGSIHTSYALNFRRDFIQLYMVDRKYGLRSWESK